MNGYMIDATLNFANGEERDVDPIYHEEMDVVLSTIKYMLEEPGVSSVVFSIVRQRQ